MGCLFLSVDKKKPVKNQLLQNLFLSSLHRANISIHTALVTSSLVGVNQTFTGHLYRTYGQ